MIISDADLSAQFAAGNAEAVRDVYLRFGGLVYSIAYKVLGDVGLAEDATQQTFVKAWGAAGDFDPSRRLGPWLATIAQRAAIDLFRRERRHGHMGSGRGRPGVGDLGAFGGTDSRTSGKFGRRCSS